MSNLEQRNDSNFLPALNADRGTHGELIQYKDRQHLLQDGTAIPPDRQFLVIGMAEVIQFWQGGRPDSSKDIVKQPGKEFPDVAALNDQVPKNQWELNLNGEPRPPWSLAYAVYLFDYSKDAQIYTHINSTNGQRVAYHINAVFRHDQRAAVLPGLKARERIGERAPARQGDPQERSIEPEDKPIGALVCRGRGDGPDCGAIEGMPEPLGCRMLPAPCVTITLDRLLARSVALGCEVLPGADTALVTEGQVADLAIGARALLGMPDRAATVDSGSVLTKRASQLAAGASFAGVVTSATPCSSIFANRNPFLAFTAIGSPSAQAGTAVTMPLNSSMVPKPSGTSQTTSSCTCRTTG